MISKQNIYIFTKIQISLEIYFDKILDFYTCFNSQANVWKLFWNIILCFSNLLNHEQHTHIYVLEKTLTKLLEAWDSKWVLIKMIFLEIIPWNWFLFSNHILWLWDMNHLFSSSKLNTRVKFHFPFFQNAPMMANFQSTKSPNCRGLLWHGRYSS